MSYFKKLFFCNIIPPVRLKKTGRSRINMTHQDRTINVWVREKTWS